MKSKLLLSLSFLSMSTSLVLADETEIKSVADDRKELEITVYNGGIAQVRDARSIKFAKGIQRLHFEDVASKIMPQTSLFKAAGTDLLEQNFDYDLLSPQKLLQKAVGTKVKVYRTHPTTGEDTLEEATVLSANGQAVLQFADRIEVLGEDAFNGRIVYSEVPKNLRARPTLSLLLDSENTRKKEASLTYLTQGVKWSADYVANLNDDQTKMDLQAWITMNNQSGVAFENAQLNLIAGDVRLVRDYNLAGPGREDSNVEEIVVTGSRTAERSDLGDYFMYTIPFKTTILNNQQKQLSLFKANNVSINKIYEMDGYGTNGDGKKFEHARLELEINNEKSAGLGLPLPNGIIRFYLNDKNAKAKFVGENFLTDIPVGRRANIEYGEAFNVTNSYEAKSLNSECWTQDKRRYCVSEHELTIVLKNALDEDIQVNYQHGFNNKVKLIKANYEPNKTNERSLKWQVKIPKKGETIITLHVKTGFLDLERKK